MSRVKRWLCACLSLVMLLCACPTVRAAESVKTDAKVSLTVRFEYEGQPIAGAKYKVYRVASIDAAGTFTLDGDFASYPVSLGNETAEEWDSLAMTLKGMAAVDGLVPTAVLTTGDNGKSDKAELTTGLYLVVGEKFNTGKYSYMIQPAMVSLPGQLPDGTWTYDVTVMPKSERNEIPENYESLVVSRRVLKIWMDDGKEEDRPEYITVHLTKDGAIYDTIKMTASGDWRYEWTNLPEYDSKGGKIEWDVVEEKRTDYTVRTTQSGMTLLVTNTKTGVKPEHNPPSDPHLPSTGLLWWPVSVLLIAGFTLLIVGIRRRKSE